MLTRVGSSFLYRVLLEVGANALKYWLASLGVATSKDTQARAHVQ